MMDQRIPVTLLTGFLGAGKTTLLNQLLAEAGSAPIAVIVNEFGEVGIDNDLVETSRDDVVLMESGCLCCTIRGDLAITMSSLIHRRNSGELDFERIVIETTGLADPGPILQVMVSDLYLTQVVRMDGVVTVVDAVNAEQTLDAQFESVSQVAMADLIVLSKTDLVMPDRLASLESRLHSLNSAVSILRSERGTDLKDRLWGLSATRRGISPKETMTWLKGAASAAPNADPLANLSGFADKTAPAPAFNPHDSRIGTASIILDDPVPNEAFEDWFDTLVALRGPDLLRVKGIVFLEDMEAPFVFHGVQTVFDPPVPVADWPSDDRQTRIVVIARDITRPELQRSFDMLRNAPRNQQELANP